MNNDASIRCLIVLQIMEIFASAASTCAKYGRTYVSDLKQIINAENFSIIENSAELNAKHMKHLLATANVMVSKCLLL